jgi:hypothetical protein
VATKSLEFPELAFYVSQPLFEQRFLSLEQDATVLSAVKVSFPSSSARCTDLGGPSRRANVNCDTPNGAPSMCDYSLHLVASRPTKVGDKLVATDFVKSYTRGFAAVSEPGVAVCLLPGTELAFDENVQYERAFGPFGRACVDHKVARFRQVNMHDPHVHHDALEFPDGQIVLVTRLVAGQHASVLQLPASTRDHAGAKESVQVSSAERIDG